MSAPLPNVPSLSTSHTAHLALLNSLNSFEAVEAWDKEAAQLITGAQRHIAQLGQVAKELDAIERERGKLQLASRLFTWLLQSMPIGVRRAQLARERAAAELVIDDLQGAIDKTPDTKAERKAMLQDLRAVKKELTLKKREITAAMRDVRAHASTRGAVVGAGWSGLLTTPSSRRYQRMGIRLEKEAALEPHKGQRDVVESQIAVIDRHIIWLEKIR